MNQYVQRSHANSSKKKMTGKFFVVSTVCQQNPKTILKNMHEYNLYYIGINHTIMHNFSSDYSI